MHSAEPAAANVMPTDVLSENNVLSPYQIVIYEPRPGDAIEAAIRQALSWGLWPVHLIVSLPALDHISRDVDPPGRSLLSVVHGLNIVVDEDWLGCNLICEVPFPFQHGENIADLMVVWDIGAFVPDICDEDDCECE